MSRRLLVVGNWKMNGTVAFARELAAAVRHGAQDCLTTDIVVCPPFPFLRLVADEIGGSAVGLGAQSLSQFESGAYTGEVSADMLTDCGCGYVIVGHSERRAGYGESSDIVAAKALAAANGGLRPIICVGETLAEREADATESVISAQLAPILSSASGTDWLKDAIFAYEPVWAIGTGMTATPEQAQSVHAFIRGSLGATDQSLAINSRILYGGSVKPDNASALFGMGDVDGGLIGGASLKSADFLSICGAQPLI